uniref:PPPDE domain-containing protein n=2 Tax=Alexandrium monilatum TaxID=311494 RepID=A0A6T1J9P0_9DINO
MGNACVRTPLEDEYGGGPEPLEQGADSPAEVTLHIYDVGTSGSSTKLNGLLRPLGAGVFHCGVEVFGGEWSYSDTVTGAGAAIFCDRPRCCPGHTYVESLAMGRTSLREFEFLSFIRASERDWTAERYDVLKRNCCHFSDYVCRRLGVGAIPLWAKSLADTGAALADTKDKCSEVFGQAADALCCKASPGAEIVEMVDVCRYSSDDLPRARRVRSSAKLSL